MISSDGRGRFSFQAERESGSRQYRDIKKDNDTSTQSLFKSSEYKIIG